MFCEPGAFYQLLLSTALEWIVETTPGDALNEYQAEVGLKLFSWWEQHETACDDQYVCILQVDLNPSSLLNFFVTTLDKKLTTISSWLENRY